MSEQKVNVSEANVPEVNISEANVPEVAERSGPESGAHQSGAGRPDAGHSDRAEASGVGQSEAGGVDRPGAGQPAGLSSDQSGTVDQIGQPGVDRSDAGRPDQPDAARPAGHATASHRHHHVQGSHCSLPDCARREAEEAREAAAAGAGAAGAADAQAPDGAGAQVTAVRGADDTGATGGVDATGADLEQPSQEVRDLFGLAFAGAEHFAQMLAEEGQLRGLVGPRELPRLWSRHIVNSAAVVPFLPRRGTVVDVGSGAGFPGVVVALLRPDLEVTLMEAMERRVEWLDVVVEELGLDNVTVRRARAEEVGEQYDVVTARALANLSKLVRLTARLVRPGGAILALKGSRAEAEVEEARYVIKKARFRPAVVHDVVAPGEDLTKVVELRRTR